MAVKRGSARARGMHLVSRTRQAITTLEAIRGRTLDRGTVLVSGVASSRLLLAPKQDKESTNDAYDECSRLLQKIWLNYIVPDPYSCQLLNGGLKSRERVRVDVCPSRAYAADVYRLIGDRLSAVVHHK